MKRQSFYRLVWNQYKRRRVSLVALGIVLLLFAIAILAPVLANHQPIVLKRQGRLYFLALKFYPQFVGEDFDYLRQSRGESEWALFPPIPFSPHQADLESILRSPNRVHWLGTDDTGRDVLSRMIYGSRISLSVGFVAVGIYVVIGILVGAIAGYFGGKIDMLFQRVVEVFMCFPTLILVIAIVAIFPPSIYTVMVAIGLSGWTGVARLVRGEFLKLRSQEFVTAAEALGLSTPRIIFRHILPNALAPVFVTATFGIAGAILIESSLSFLGFGVPPPTPSWGEILSQSRDYIQTAWWLTLFPGLAIFVSITAYNLIGEGLREAIDARLKI
jgi:peptide/nickel transport system permease protein